MKDDRPRDSRPLVQLSSGSASDHESESPFYELREGIVWFSEEIKREHRRLKTSLWRYVRRSRFLIVDTELDRFLHELEAEGQQNDSHEKDRKNKFLNLERPTAELIHVLLQASRRKHVLEIGTSNAYSTIWIATALKYSDEARLVSIEIAPHKLALARKNVARARLAHKVELIEGNATEVVASLRGPFDCVFFDADRISAPAQLRLLLPKLSDDVLLLADNTLSHPDEISAYKTFVEQLPGFICTVTPVGKGLHIAWRSGRIHAPPERER